MNKLVTQIPRGEPISSTTANRPTSDLWLAKVLVDEGVLLGVQAEELKLGAGESIWSRAVTRGYTTDAIIVKTLSVRFKVPAADMAAADPRAATLLPESVARKHRVVPIYADDRVITLATSDPHDFEVEETLRFVTGRRIALQVASPELIDKKVDEVYRPEKAINRLLAGLDPSGVESIEDVQVGTSGIPRWKPR